MYNLTVFSYETVSIKWLWNILWCPWVCEAVLNTVSLLHPSDIWKFGVVLYWERPPALDTELIISVHFKQLYRSCSEFFFPCYRYGRFPHCYCTPGAWPQCLCVIARSACALPLPHGNTTVGIHGPETWITSSTSRSVPLMQQKSLSAAPFNSVP